MSDRNKKNRNGRGAAKFAGLTLALGLLGLSFGTEMVSAQSATVGNVEMEIEFGLNGNYRYGSGIPIRMTLETETDFEGLLQIIVPQGNQTNVAYEKDIVLSAGSPKTVSMTVNSDTILSYVTVQLLDGKGKVVAEQELGTEMVVSNNPLVGVLSDDYSALDYFSAVQIDWEDGYSYTSAVTELSEETFPDCEEGLDALSYLIINSYDTSALSEEQQKLILDWTAAGGVLIVGTGPDMGQTLSMFDPSVLNVERGSAAVGDLKVFRNDISAKAYTQEDGIYNIHVEDAEPLREVMEEEGMIWNRPYERGNIVVTSFNLGMEPVNSWGFKAGFASRLLSKAAGEDARRRMIAINEGYDSVPTYLLDQLYFGEAPNIYLLAGMLLVFALLPPITYLILKKIGRSGYLWAAIPLEAVLMAGAIFGVTSHLRIHNPITSSIVYIDGQKTNGQAYMSITCPDIRNNKVSFDENVSRVKMGANWHYDYADLMQDGKNYDYTIYENAQGTTLGLKCSSNFERNYCQFCVPKQDKGKLEADMTRTLAGVSGSVTNKTGIDLQAVCIYTHNSLIMLGELADGETLSFDEDDNRTFYYVYDLDFPGIDRNSALYQIVTNVYEDSYYDLLNNSSNENLVLLMGVSMNSGEDYITDPKVIENNILVYRDMTELSFADYPGAEVFNLFSYAGDVMGDWDSNDGQLYSRNVEVTFDMEEEINEVYAMSRSQDSFTFYGNTENTKVYAYNYQTGAYEEIFADGRITEEFVDGCPYLQDGKIRMRFTCSEAYNDYAPKITLIGGYK